MAHFRYKGRDRKGNEVSGRLEALNRDDATGQLIAGGIMPAEIEESAATGDGDVLAPLRKFFAAKPDLDDLILFSRQMYTLSKAGVPMIRAFRGLRESQKKPAIVDALEDVVNGIEGGRDLSSSLGQHPEIFPPLFVNLVRVGENTGQLDTTFLQLSEYFALDKETRDRIKAATRYPTFVVGALAVAMIILNIFVIPAFANVFARFGTELPLPTRILLAISQFFVAYWPHMLAAGIGVVIGLTQYVKTAQGKLLWDRYKLHIPVVGDVIFRALLARFCRSFALAVRAGVPLVQALSVSARAIDNDYLAGKILAMRHGIERGDSITRTAAGTGMFTPLVMQMFAVGDETGAVDDMMFEVAEFYEREVDYDIKNLTSAIEPILTVAVGVMVLVLALGIFLPMWDLGKAAIKH